MVIQKRCLPNYSSILNVSNSMHPTMWDVKNHLQRCVEKENKNWCRIVKRCCLLYKRNCWWFWRIPVGVYCWKTSGANDFSVHFWWISKRTGTWFFKRFIIGKANILSWLNWSIIDSTRDQSSSCDYGTRLNPSLWYKVLLFFLNWTILCCTCIILFRRHRIEPCHNFTN